MEQISDMSEYIDGRLQEMIALVYGYEINNGRVSINDFKDNYIIQLALKDKIYNDKYRMFCNKFFYMDEQLKKIKYTWQIISMAKPKILNWILKTS